MADTDERERKLIEITAATVLRKLGQTEVTFGPADAETVLRDYDVGVKDHPEGGMTVTLHARGLNQADRNQLSWGVRNLTAKQKAALLDLARTVGMKTLAGVTEFDGYVAHDSLDNPRVVSTLIPKGLVEGKKAGRGPTYYRLTERGAKAAAYLMERP